MLYYAYEHPWMIASQEHWGYPKNFYNKELSPEQRKFFHGFVFDPTRTPMGIAQGHPQGQPLQYKARRTLSCV